MAKPTVLPRWATGATAPVIEPTEAKKDEGWAPAEKPPAEYWNWWRRGVSEWLAYLNGLTNEALTWAAKHSFQAGLSSAVAPSAATDVARKAEVDAAAAAAASALAAVGGTARTWTALQTMERLRMSGYLGGDPAWAVADGDIWLSASANKLRTRLDGDAVSLATEEWALGAAAVSPAINAPWTPGAGADAVAYLKRVGVVHLRGYARSAAGAGTGLFVLPNGFRPAAERTFVVPHLPANHAWSGVEFAAVSVGANGVVSVQNPVAIRDYYLDGVSFAAEQ